MNRAFIEHLYETRDRFQRHYSDLKRQSGDRQKSDDPVAPALLKERLQRVEADIGDTSDLIDRYWLAHAPDQSSR